MKKVAVVGSGIVGQVLADGFLKHGYEVIRASREPSKLEAWQQAAGAKASVAPLGEAARAADLVVLAVKGTGAEEAVAACGEGLAGKTVLDATNPIANAPPTNGVLSFFTSLEESLMERLQKKAPSARFVKAFSCVGNNLMVNPELGGSKPTMFICGTSPEAKAEAKTILGQFGWETEDLGAVEAARAIEPLCMLWCIPGMLGHGWNHAFKLLRA
ncbi:MAG TPA: NAD(P)-binding domain-containing protein [Polyangiaceae bacterium]|nr:NAD(P)-binding domain-containing protein [Polyangiaceae bacterium]